MADFLKELTADEIMNDLLVYEMLENMQITPWGEDKIHQENFSIDEEMTPNIFIIIQKTWYNLKAHFKKWLNCGTFIYVEKSVGENLK